MNELTGGGLVGSRNWRLRVAGSNAANLVVPPDEPNVVRIAITQANSNSRFDIQLNLNHLKVEANQSYIMNFRARADSPRPVSVGVAQAHDPWLGLGYYEEVQLSAEWREFQREFVATASDDQARIHFDLGAHGAPVEVSLSSFRVAGFGAHEQRGGNVLDLDLGVFGTVTPISRNWGFDRGQAIDRYYVEKFLASHAAGIRGFVLEIEDDMYTRQFGSSAVTNIDVLHVTTGNPRATIVADLTNAVHIPSDRFDCALVTQTLQFIYDVRAAVATLHRILKPGGILLATFPGITKISQDEWKDFWYWRFTSASARRLFGDIFGAPNVEVQAHGNVLTAVSFLHGLAQEDLPSGVLDHRDPDFEVIITVRAVKEAPAS